jgi:hypothetical protein
MVLSYMQRYYIYYEFLNGCNNKDVGREIIHLVMDDFESKFGRHLSSVFSFLVSIVHTNLYFKLKFETGFPDGGWCVEVRSNDTCLQKPG